MDDDEVQSTPIRAVMVRGARLLGEHPSLMTKLQLARDGAVMDDLD